MYALRSRIRRDGDICGSSASRDVGRSTGSVSRLEGEPSSRLRVSQSYNQLNFLRPRFLRTIKEFVSYPPENYGPR